VGVSQEGTMNLSVFPPLQILLCCSKQRSDESFLPEENTISPNGLVSSQMVAGRFVNVYSTNDWILGITFRARYNPTRASISELILLVCAGGD